MGTANDAKEFLKNHRERLEAIASDDGEVAKLAERILTELDDE